MKRVLFITNYASPYRVRFFDELGKGQDVTVLFTERTEDQKHRSADWFAAGQGNFQIAQLDRRIGRKKGKSLCIDVIDWLRKPYEIIVLCGYSSPTFMLAMAYLRLKKIPFYIEIDGGLIREDSWLKYRFKKRLVGSATYWISSGAYTTRYLVHYGAREEDVFFYPFSSLSEKEIREKIVTKEEKNLLRQQLEIAEKNVILSVGQFIHRKGFDVLLKAAAKLPEDTGIYIVGGEPTEEYLQLAKELGLKNVHFLGFMKKEALSQYYQAADLFVLPTREDIWGLVINEAMAYGLPVVTTDRCVAGLELVEDGVNGYIVPVEDEAALAEKICTVLAGDVRQMGEASLEKIRPYTIENMAKVHADIFQKNC